MRNRYPYLPNFTQERFLECLTVEKIHIFIIISINHFLISRFFASLITKNIVGITLPNKVKKKKHLFKIYMDSLLFLQVAQAWTYGG